MKVAIEKHKPGIVGDFLDALAASARQLGHSVVRYPLGGRSLPKAVSIVWNGRHHRALGPTLYCEHAWLPRWDYQISPKGINADSHIAPFVWDGVPLSEERLTELDQRLEEIRQVGPSSYSYMQTAEPALTDLPEAFLLVPLQMAFDTNIQRHVPSRFRSMQALVDHVTAANPPYPIIFKQHPADLRRGNRQLNLRLERKHDSIRPHGRGNIHQYLKSGRCKGVVALNSNVVHDGLLWDLDMPVVVLGRNIWPRSGPTPFLTAIPSEWDEFEKQRHCADTAACRRAYAHYLTRCQWTLDQARDPGRVQALLAGLEGPRRPPTTRTPTIRIRSEPRLERINLCARNQKWFFEDLKRHFVSRAKGRFDILATETPVRGANAWIFIRTKEAAASPDPERTLVQVHDMFDQRLYRPGGERACVRRCEALMLTHPDQKTILGKAGVPLAGKRVLCRPIGALEAFSLRNALTDRFTFAWVGRPASHRGRELKRADWFVEAAKRLGPPCRAVLLGERLENHHKILRQAGVDSVYLDRKFNSIETYPEHYKSFDCIVVTSLSEAGPLCLFEALATGVPVISTPVGWAPRLIRDGQNGYIAGSIDEIVEALRCIRGERAIWLQRREAIRESLNGYTLESWVDLCLETAADLTRKPRPRSSRRLVKLMGAQ